MIVGNPPFLGDKKMRAELGDKYVEDLRALYAGRVPGGADLVTYWFEKARAQIEAGRRSGRGCWRRKAIRGGSQSQGVGADQGDRRHLLGAVDRPWVLDGAAVRRLDGGVRCGRGETAVLDGRAVTMINSDLTSRR